MPVGSDVCVPLFLVPGVAHLGDVQPVVVRHAGQGSLQIGELLLDLGPLLSISLDLLLKLLLSPLLPARVHPRVDGVIDLISLAIISLVGPGGEQAASVAFELGREGGGGGGRGRKRERRRGREREREKEGEGEREREGGRELTQ